MGTLGFFHGRPWRWIALQVAEVQRLNNGMQAASYTNLYYHCQIIVTDTKCRVPYFANIRLENLEKYWAFLSRICLRAARLVEVSMGTVLGSPVAVASISWAELAICLLTSSMCLWKDQKTSVD